MKNVEYLGDGLYAAFDGYQICLMANSHTEPTDMVYLDPHVYSSLQKYVSRVTAQQSVQPTLLESPRSGSHSCTCALCKGSHTTLPQSG